MNKMRTAANIYAFAVAVIIFCSLIFPGSVEAACPGQRCNVAVSALGTACTVADKCSVATAQTLAVAGDTIYFAPGNYNQSVTINKSGVTYEGTVDNDGNRLSVIDPSVAISETSWSAAGSGVYKTSRVGFDPFVMILEVGGETYDIARLCNPTVDAWHGGYCNGWWEELTKPANAIYTESGITVPHWQGIEALYASDGTYVYVRFRDGSNPSSMDLRVSRESSGIYMYAVSNVTIKNFKIRAADNGILVGSFHSGQPDERRSSDVIIQNNEILNGRIKLRIDGERITIRDNILHGQSYANFKAGYTPGPWIGGVEQEHVVNAHIYHYYKYKIGAGNSGRDEDGLLLMGTGSTIYNNEFYDMLDGIGAYGSDHEIYNNTIHDTPSTGFFSDGRFGSDNSSFHDNLIYNVNDSLRFGSFDKGAVGLHIYNNRIYLPNGVGRHIHYHVEVGECLDRADNDGDGKKDYGTAADNDSKCSSVYDNNESQIGFQTKPTDASSYIWWYHNSFSGGAEFSYVSEFIRSWTPNIMQNVRYVDNVISTGQFEHNSSDSITVGLCAYNWIYGTDKRWCSAGEGNVYGIELMWPPAPPEFSLPDNASGNAAKGSGVNIRKTPAYSFLPWESDISYPDSSPDMGALQTGNPADVNGDGNVNIKDIQEVIRAIINPPGNPRADVNGDEQVNIKDIQEIIREIIKT